MARKVNVQKGKQGFQKSTAGATHLPTSATSARKGFLQRLFHKSTAASEPSPLDPDNPFAEILNNWANNPHSSATSNPTTPAPRVGPDPRPLPNNDQRDAQWKTAWATAKTDYRYGAHETAHNRIASLLEAHDTNTHGPFTYTTHTGETVETPLDPDASAHYIKTIASDIVELHDNQQTSDGLRGARGIYSRQTVELAREVVTARESSAAGPSTPDLYRLAQYEQSDGTTRNAWHLKPRVGMLLAAIERDQQNSAHLAHARNDETARRQAAEKRYSELPW